MINMRKMFLTVSVIVLFCLNVCAVTLQTGVSIEKVPKMFFGSWQVEAQLEKTSNYSIFKPRSHDLWNLSRTGNVITLENPFTKAKADIQLSKVEDKVVVFTKTSSYDNKVLRDSVTIRLGENTFAGYNDIILETRSLYDGHVLKSETAKYLIKGTKISGSSVLK